MQHFRADKTFCPALKLRLLQPFADRYGESLFGPFHHFLRYIPVKHLAQNSLPHSSLTLIFNRKAPCKFHNILIQHGNPCFKRNSHGGPVYLHKNVIRMIHQHVHQHNLMIGLRDFGYFACFVRIRPGALFQSQFPYKGIIFPGTNVEIHRIFCAKKRSFNPHNLFRRQRSMQYEVTCKLPDSIRYMTHLIPDTVNRLIGSIATEQLISAISA